MRWLRVEKPGDDLVVRLPADFAVEHGLREGDEVMIAGGRRAIPQAEREEQRREAVARMAQKRLKLPADFRFDRDEANER
jgi:antitoxin MazE